MFNLHYAMSQYLFWVMTDVIHTTLLNTMISVWEFVFFNECVRLYIYIYILSLWLHLQSTKRYSSKHFIVKYTNVWIDLTIKKLKLKKFYFEFSLQFLFMNSPSINNVNNTRAVSLNISVTAVNGAVMGERKQNKTG